MPLVDGHGNFGSIEGDGAAAMRYTEARLQKFAEEVYLKDLDKTVRFVPNYDETEKEPEVLPVRVPNLLINGAEGIAVGMSTSIPPHNLGEVIDTVMAYIDQPEMDDGSASERLCRDRISRQVASLRIRVSFRRSTRPESGKHQAAWPDGGGAWKTPF